MVELSIHFGHHNLVFAQCEPIFEVIRAIGEVDIQAILKRCVENVVLVLNKQKCNLSKHPWDYFQTFEF